MCCAMHDSEHLIPPHPPSTMRACSVRAQTHACPLARPAGACYCNATLPFGRIPADPGAPPGTPPQRVGRQVSHYCKRDTVRPPCAPPLALGAAAVVGGWVGRQAGKLQPMHMPLPCHVCTAAHQAALLILACSLGRRRRAGTARRASLVTHPLRSFMGTGGGAPPKTPSSNAPACWCALARKDQGAAGWRAAALGAHAWDGLAAGKAQGLAAGGSRSPCRAPAHGSRLAARVLACLPAGRPGRAHV